MNLLRPPFIRAIRLTQQPLDFVDHRTAALHFTLVCFGCGSDVGAAMRAGLFMCMHIAVAVAA
jgi:hypothetical protein